MLNTVFGTLSSGVAASTNSYESISSVTVGAGGSSTISFTSISSSYTHLQIRVLSKSTTAGTANASFTAQFNSDTGSNYTRHALIGDGASGSSSGSASQTSIRAGGNAEANSTNIFAVSVIDILDYANTNKYKTLRTLFGSDLNGTGEVSLRSGAWLSTSAITSIVLTPSSGNFGQYSSFALYGIKGV